MKKKQSLSPERKALLKSLGVHSAIAAVLLISITFTPEPLPELPGTAPVIEATFIDAQAIADKKRAQQQAEAQARAEEQERQRRAQEAQRQAEQKRAAERRAAEKRKAEEAERKRQQELKKVAAQKEKERKEREAKAKAEAERKRKAEQEKAEMERIMQEQLEAEQAAQRQRRAKQVVSEVERYQALIQSTVQRHLIEDDSFKGKQCLLNIRLATTGLVTKVTILEGDPVLCKAAERAVLRPNKLPVSDEPDVYEKLKDINIRVDKR